jgi:outer membrane protein assembly factor BamA
MTPTNQHEPDAAAPHVAASRFAASRVAAARAAARPVVSRLVVALLLAAFSLAPRAVAAGSAAGQRGKMKLAKIEVVGLQTVRPEEIVAASGLSVGQEFDLAALDAAAERVLASGLVTKLEYRLREAAGQATVTFEVAEAKRAGNVPVVFDNFVWFTREQLTEAVRAELPDFDGRISDARAAVAAVTRALERLLKGRGIEGQIEYMPATDEGGRNPRHVFTARGVSLPVCALRFPGAASVAEAELVSASQQVSGDDYSQEMIGGFAGSALRAIYERRGHLKVRFGEPRASLEAEGACKDRVAVSVPVEEGASYNWAGASWPGAAALTPAELDAALGMRAGEVANVEKIERQLMRGVRAAYGRKGYIAANWRESREFDDAARTVRYRFDLREGPQYRMGALHVAGLPEAEAARVRAMWKLPAGEVFDASYINAFTMRALPDLMRTLGREVRVGAETKPDPQKLTVDVTVSFKLN